VTAVHQVARTSSCTDRAGTYDTATANTQDPHNEHRQCSLCGSCVFRRTRQAAGRVGRGRGGRPGGWRQVAPAVSARTIRRRRMHEAHIMSTPWCSLCGSHVFWRMAGWLDRGRGGRHARARGSQRGVGLNGATASTVSRLGCWHEHVVSNDECNVHTCLLHRRCCGHITKSEEEESEDRISLNLKSCQCGAKR
jgi:hypothetical protein